MANVVIQDNDNEQREENGLRERLGLMNEINEDGFRERLGLMNEINVWTKINIWTKICF